MNPQSPLLITTRVAFFGGMAYNENDRYETEKRTNPHHGGDIMGAMSLNLTPANESFVKTVSKGRRSRVVNQALDAWRHRATLDDDYSDGYKQPSLGEASVDLLLKMAISGCWDDVGRDDRKTDATIADEIVRVAGAFDALRLVLGSAGVKL